MICGLNCIKLLSIKSVHIQKSDILMVWWGFLYLYFYIAFCLKPIVFCLKQKSMRKSTRNLRVLTSRTYMTYFSLGKNMPYKSCNPGATWKSAWIRKVHYVGLRGINSHIPVALTASTILSMSLYAKWRGNPQIWREKNNHSYLSFGQFAHKSVWFSSFWTAGIFWPIFPNNSILKK